MSSMKLKIPSNRTLGTICVYGAFLSISAVMYMRWKLEDRVRSAEYYKLALKTLRQHKGAVGLLGEPIKDSGIDISNANNTCNAESAQLEVSVRGSKDKGTLYFWATNHLEKGWLIDRLELEAKKHPNKRFLLRKPEEVTTDQQEDQQVYASEQYYGTEGFAQKARPLHKAEETTPIVQTTEGGSMR